MNVVLQHAHPILGSVPGPLSLATFGDVIWAAGGGRGFSAVFRFTEESGWLHFGSSARGLRAILPMSSERAIVVGEYGHASIIDINEQERCFHTGTDACLFALTRKPDGDFLTAGDDGTAFILRPGAHLEAQKTTLGSSARTTQVDLSGERQILVTANGLQRGQQLVLPTPAPLTRYATSPDGLIALTGDDNQLYVGTSVDTLERFDTQSLGDLETVLWHRDAFIVGAKGALARVDIGKKTVTRFLDTPSDERVTALISWKDGLLGASWKQVGPPFAFKGSVFFEGDDAPSLVKQPARQNLPGPRPRTVALDVTHFLDATAGQLISLEEAMKRVPMKTWPDTQHGTARYFDGNVRVSAVDELLSNTCDRGYVVVINGHLVVDGFLDARAGGDGYDSLLVVAGDLHARFARFAYCVTAVCEHLEVETAILCDHGDDGGSLWTDRVTAQVFSYDTYFSKPSCPIDAFCIGDVYGERSFPPERAREVFVSEALDAAGGLDERAASRLFAMGRSIVRHE